MQIVRLENLQISCTEIILRCRIRSRDFLKMHVISDSANVAIVKPIH
uniref:Uncharacterized protein n=1 Tax=Arundo donax TaxID=35708 RepID=A0A0A8YUK1_ARUDO